MLTPEVISNLIELGTAGIIILLLLTGWLVPKAFYDREVKRGDTATGTASTNAEAVRDTASALKTVTDEVKGVRDEMKSVRAELASVKEELLRSQK